MMSGRFPKYGLTTYNTLLDGIDYQNLWENSVRTDQILDHFCHLESQICQWRLLRRVMHKLSPNCASYISFRLKFIRSYACLSVVHYIYGIGDRHPSNFLISLENGEIIGIDFGYAFGVTSLVLPIPELVPFRLTAVQREFLEPVGPMGSFGQTMIHTFSVLRSAAPLMNTLIRIFIKDSSNWELFSHIINQEQVQFTEERLKLAQNKIIGYSPGNLLLKELNIRYEHTNWLSKLESIINDITRSTVNKNNEQIITPEEQTLQLIRLASSSELLSRANIGWQSFL